MKTKRARNKDRAKTTLIELGRRQRDEPWFYVFHVRYSVPVPPAYDETTVRCWVEAAVEQIRAKYLKASSAARYRLERKKTSIVLYLEEFDQSVLDRLAAEFGKVEVKRRTGLPLDHPTLIAERERLRIEAANKAWETRRASGDTGTSAAKKAWATRRAQGWKPKNPAKARVRKAPADDGVRSAAANKAWATRRANGWVHPSQRSGAPA